MPRVLWWFDSDALPHGRATAPLLRWCLRVKYRQPLAVAIYVEGAAPGRWDCLPRAGPVGFALVGYEGGR